MVSLSSDRLTLDLSGRSSFNPFKTVEQKKLLRSFSHDAGILLQFALIPDIIAGTSYRFYANGVDDMKTNFFHIWNATIACKFSKNRLFEAKFSALDLLKQNTGVINLVNGNNISLGRINRLPGFFMLSLSYFPRKFSL